MKNNKTTRLILIALMSSISLALYGIETFIPPLVPLPGVKMGLANVVTLVCMYVLNVRASFVVLLVRIALSSILFGQPVSFLFSLSGGVLSFCTMALLKRYTDESNIWALSVFGSFAHNLGQIIAAVIITGELSVAYYFLFLIISSVITGVCTGACAQTAIKKLKKLHI